MTIQEHALDPHHRNINGLGVSGHGAVLAHVEKYEQVSEGKVQSYVHMGQRGSLDYPRRTAKAQQ